MSYYDKLPDLKDKRQLDPSDIYDDQGYAHHNIDRTWDQQKEIHAAASIPKPSRDQCRCYYPGCGRMYGNRDRKETHTNKTHSRPPQDYNYGPDIEGRFRCPLCYSTFERLVSIYQHLRKTCKNVNREEKEKC